MELSLISATTSSFRFLSMPHFHQSTKEKRAMFDDCPSCFVQRKGDIAPSCFRYLSEFARTFGGGVVSNAFLKFLMVHFLSPFVAYASPRLSNVFGVLGYRSVLIVNISIGLSTS